MAIHHLYEFLGFLVRFPAWDLKCRTQLDILSRIYQMGFIEGIGRWLLHRAAGEVQIPWQPLDVVLFEGTGEKRNWPKTSYVCVGGSSGRRALPLLGLCHHHGMAGGHRQSVLVVY